MITSHARHFLLWTLLAAGPAHAQGQPGEIPAQDYPGLDWPYVPLDLHDQSVLSLSKEWQEKATPAFLGKNGNVIYHFGESVATVITSPGNVTSIELQPGEFLHADSIFVGDTVNWEIVPSLQESGETSVTHIIVKPRYAHLETTMIIVTNRRRYHFHLKSTDGEHMAGIAFQYPLEETAYMEDYLARIRERREEERVERQIILPEVGGRDITDLDFSYDVSTKGSALPPTRVYNDGIQVYIQMPESMSVTEAPAFIDLSGPSSEIVNYRLKGTTYVVDKLFTEGMLVSGSGKTSREVHIRYKGGAG